jgi:[acyl-carrier-protein] S-malonyltransferase
MSLSIVFPGQGSQSPGMGKWLYEQFPVAQKTFQEASDVLKFDVKKLCFEGTDAELQLTANTQPALLTVSTATARALMSEMNLKADFTAGHSIGEYASFVLAEVLSFSTAIQAVRTRGEAMQSAVPVGAGSMMALMGVSEDQAYKICRWASGKSEGHIQPANFNSPGQVVISGSSSVMQFLKDHFMPQEVLGENIRVKMIPLNVSAPFHCEMMKPAEKKMDEFFKSIDFKEAKIPVVQNLIAEPVTEGPKLKHNLIQQVSGSVRWMQSIQKLSQLGCQNFVECGHGQVLKGLIKKTAEASTVFSTQSLEDFKLIETHLKAMGH